MKMNKFWSMIMMLVMMVSASLSVSSCSDDDDEMGTLKHNGHAYVDLGLPSGLKWATMNIGAKKPEDYGWYLAWGETKPKNYYDWSTYSNSEDDAAHVNWGGKWRMPTRAEQDELRSEANCIWTETWQNGVWGFKVTSKKNGNSIFLPAAGYRFGDEILNEGSYGNYWSSTLYGSDRACCLDFESYGADWNYYYCRNGLSVRAVCP